MNTKPKTARQIMFELGNYPVNLKRVLINSLKLYSPGIFIYMIMNAAGADHQISFITSILLSSIGLIAYILMINRNEGFELYYKVLKIWDQEKGKFEEGQREMKQAQALKLKYSKIEDDHKYEINNLKAQISKLESESFRYNNQIKNQDDSLKYLKRENENLEKRLAAIGNANQIKAAGAVIGFKDAQEIERLKRSYNAINEEKYPDKKEAAKNEILSIANKYNYNPF
jgi:septal ring factor EnvC (AmiA/AmiB activator)